MCGIVGKAAQFALPPDLPLRAMSDAMTHRGPDDEGIWFSPDRRVGLAHRRLSIIDLSCASRQPMSNVDGAVQVVFNGEIYNFADLRGELVSLGHSFRTTGDTEVLVAAYLQWGEGCVKRLHGMFAFGLWDGRRARLLLARDRAGEKPLFYRHNQGSLAFASELKSLLEDRSVPRRLDVGSMNFFCAYGYVPGDRCILESFRKLPPAHLATYDVDQDRLTVRRYWTLPNPSANAGNEASESDYVDQLAALLGASVKRQLVADVPVAILLSGGLDSSIVTALAASVSSEVVRTFTIAFPGGGTYNESRHARIVANHFGTNHTELEMQPASVDLLPVLSRQFDEPLGDSSIVPTFLVSRLVRSHATVALGGDGGDELFGGYLHYRWLQRQYQLRRLLPAFARKVIASGARALPLGTRGRNHLIGFAGGTASSFAHVNLYFEHASRVRLLAPLIARTGWTGSPAEPENYKGELLRHGRTPLQGATAADFLLHLPDDILVKVDRASMLTSLEVRAPFLDHNVIEFAFALPDRLRATPSANKVLLRSLARRLLPTLLDLHRKQGFSIPLQKWFKGEWGTFMADVLAGADNDIFDRHALDSLIAQQRSGLSNTHRIFALTMFELWRREYGVSA